MIPIKIQCGCGQKYTFEIEPVGGQMPWAVACPICGMDGTDAANTAITQTLTASAALVPAIASPPPPPATEAPAARLSAHASTQRTTRRLPGQIDPNQALVEARAKISWGDEPIEVVKYLMIQGFSREEARAEVREMFAERVKAVRSNGFRKIIIGIGLICVPIIGLVVFLILGFFLIKVFGVMIMAGLYGLWLLINGIVMVVSPKSERGDVAEQ